MLLPSRPQLLANLREDLMLGEGSSGANVLLPLSNELEQANGSSHSLVTVRILEDTSGLTVLR